MLSDAVLVAQLKKSSSFPTLRMGMSPSVGSLVPLTNNDWLHREGAGYSRGVGFTMHTKSQGSAYSWPHNVVGSLPARTHPTRRCSAFNRNTEGHQLHWSTPHTNVYPFPPPIPGGKSRSESKGRATRSDHVSSGASQSRRLPENARAAGPGSQREALSRSISWSNRRQALGFDNSRRSMSSSGSMSASSLKGFEPLLPRAVTAYNEKQAQLLENDAVDWAARASRPVTSIGSPVSVTEEVDNLCRRGVGMLYDEPLPWDARRHATRPY